MTLTYIESPITKCYILSASTVKYILKDSGGKDALLFTQIPFLFIFPPPWCSVFFWYHFLSGLEHIYEQWILFIFLHLRVSIFPSPPKDIFMDTEFCADSSFLSAFKKYPSYLWRPWFLMRSLQPPQATSDSSSKPGSGLISHSNSADFMGPLPAPWFKPIMPFLCVTSSHTSPHL